MSRKTKIWFITAVFLVFVGCVIFGGVMTMFKWDFTKLSTIKYETSDFEINKDYKNISIVTKTADILFVPSEHSKTSVVCYDQKNMKHLVTVEDGTLVIEIEDTRKWYEYIGINFGTPKITVYIPQGEYGTLLVNSSTGDVEIPKEFKFENIDISASTGDIKDYASALEIIKLKTSTGNICTEGISAGSLELSASTGKIIAKDISCVGDVKTKVSTGKTNITDIKCKNVVSNGGTGDVYLKNVLADEMLSVERDTGDVSMVDCDAAELFVKTSTGDVIGTLLSEKVFIAESDTGRVNVPKSITGGKCEIVTDTGDINISIQE